MISDFTNYSGGYKRLFFFAARKEQVMKLVEYLRIHQVAMVEPALAEDAQGMEGRRISAVKVSAQPRRSPMCRCGNKKAREIAIENFCFFCRKHAKKVFNNSHGWRGRRGKHGCSRKGRKEALRFKRNGGTLWSAHLLAPVAFNEACLADLMGQ